MAEGQGGRLKIFLYGGEGSNPLDADRPEYVFKLFFCGMRHITFNQTIYGIGFKNIWGGTYITSTCSSVG